jgi:serine protease AprX
VSVEEHEQGRVSFIMGGIRHGHQRRSRALAAITAAGLMAATAAIAGGGPMASSARMRLIVAAEPGSVDQVAGQVRALGGSVETELSGLDQLVVEVPTDALEQLAANPSIVGLAPNLGADLAVTSPVAAVQNTAAASSSLMLADVVNADQAWAFGIDGRGVDVAVIDSGVTPVAGLAGKVVNGPDFSSEAGYSNLAGLDGLGHGTHMAGIIAGRDSASGAKGIAPGARIVNLKVANHDGSTKVESVLQALDWVINQSPKTGYNIRVINLSFGVDGVPDHIGDPVAIAVEKAWNKGIVVVVSAGNGGASTTSLGSPATDPFVLAVGASDTGGTATTSDDVVAEFSSNGSASRGPDVVAPGVGVVSLRVPGSVLDDAYPEARMTDSLFRGNGTSQSAAVVSGVAALMIQANPSLTPNEVKARLVKSAVPVRNADRRRQGAGQVDVIAAMRLSALTKQQLEQKFEKAGKGDPLKLIKKMQEEAAKGKTTDNVETEGVVTGNRWRGNRWRGDEWQGNRWRGDHWE